MIPKDQIQIASPPDVRRGPSVTIEAQVPNDPSALFDDMVSTAIETIETATPAPETFDFAWIYTQMEAVLGKLCGEPMVAPILHVFGKHNDIMATLALCGLPDDFDARQGVMLEVGEKFLAPPEAYAYILINEGKCWTERMPDAETAKATARLSRDELVAHYEAAKKTSSPVMAYMVHGETRDGVCFDAIYAISPDRTKIVALKPPGPSEFYYGAWGTGLFPKPIWDVPPSKTT